MCFCSLAVSLVGGLCLLDISQYQFKVAIEKLISCPHKCSAVPLLFISSDFCLLLQPPPDESLKLALYELNVLSPYKAHNSTSDSYT
jgi:hypothetical protein